MQAALVRLGARPGALNGAVAAIVGPFGHAPPGFFATRGISTIERVMTDNAKNDVQSQAFQAALADLGRANE